METSPIRFHTSKSLWIEVYNIYIFNNLTQETNFDPNLINPSPDFVIIGDFNGHYNLWDHVQPPDTQGDKITYCFINNDIHVLKDGSATRTS